MTARINFRKINERSERAILLALTTWGFFLWCGIQTLHNLPQFIVFMFID